MKRLQENLIILADTLHGAGAKRPIGLAFDGVRRRVFRAACRSTAALRNCFRFPFH